MNIWIVWWTDTIESIHQTQAGAEATAAKIRKTAYGSDRSKQAINAIYVVQMTAVYP